ncbi:MAG: hypothetical protein WBJ45_08230 [Limnohabitans sp.]|uniref:hypothetical protein n=1 Tax=Limnohabitans sp. TaxID=1907725 RepID=UPI003BAE9D72
MTLIQRQTRIVRVLENVYRRKWQNPGQRSRAVRLLAEFNAKRMAFAGYTADEARASFKQCMDMAMLNINSGPLFAQQ